MNATMSKQEVREAYIASVLDKIYVRNGLYHVPSSKKGEYIVTVKNGEAYDCGCYSCCGEDCQQRNYCKHREAVNVYIARQANTQEPSIDDIAAQAEMINDQKLADFKAEQSTKKVTKWVWSLECKHRVPEGMEHEECGACLDHLYG